MVLLGWVAFPKRFCEFVSLHVATRVLTVLDRKTNEITNPSISGNWQNGHPIDLINIYLKTQGEI